MSIKDCPMWPDEVETLQLATCSGKPNSTHSITRKDNHTLGMEDGESGGYLPSMRLGCCRNRGSVVLSGSADRFTFRRILEKG